MKVIFNDTGGNQLGSAEYKDISEVLIPSYGGSYNYYVKNKFISNPAVETWKLIDLNVTHNQAILTLEEVTGAPDSVQKFFQSQNKSPFDVLPEFGIVEVDFGFYSDLIDLSGGIQKNYFQTATLMNGEIHKKRPCILLKRNSRTAQVIPLTTSASRTEKNIDVQINLGTIPGLNVRYSRPTYTLIEMIQTVSYERVFPPKSALGKYEHRYTRYKLSAPDRALVKEAISNLFNRALKIQLETTIKDNQKLSHEKFRLIESNKETKSDLKAKIDKYENLLVKLGKFVNIGDEIETITSEIERL